MTYKHEVNLMDGSAPLEERMAIASARLTEAASTGFEIAHECAYLLAAGSGQIVAWRQALRGLSLEEVEDMRRLRRRSFFKDLDHAEVIRPMRRDFFRALDNAEVDRTVDRKAIDFTIEAQRAAEKLSRETPCHFVTCRQIVALVGAAKARAVIDEALATNVHPVTLAKRFVTSAASNPPADAPHRSKP